jgi:antitoxin component YwqK of YwqJK toxin-antitoxin module
MSRTLIKNIFPLAILAASCSSPPPESYFCNEIIDQRYVHRYGVTVPRFHWEEAGQNGQIVTTLKQGITCTQNYYCGKLEGETVYTFPFSDNVEKVQVFSQDQLVKETVFYPTGGMRYEIVCNPSERTIKEWYENGCLKCYEKYSGSLLAYAEYYDSRQQRVSGIEQGSGMRSMRDNYGMLLFVDTFKEGEIEYRTCYYSDPDPSRCTPKEINPYKNGLVHGVRRTYFEGGEPKTIENWYQGKQEGLTTIFVNGERAQEVPYRQGLREGIGRVYKDGEIVIQEIHWKDDQMHGPCYTYIDDHTATEWYYKGKKVTKGYFDSFNFNPTKLSKL